VARIVARAAEPADATALAPRLRAADVEEIHAAFGPVDIADALRASLRSSVKAWTATLDGEPLFIGGVGCLSFVSGVGSPWLVAAEEATRYPAALTRVAKGFVPEMLELFPRLENWVDVRNKASAAWLARLGFTLYDPEPYGPQGLPFHRFDMEA